MKRILTVLLAIVAAPVLAAGPVKAPDIPNVLKKEPPYIQNQVCGELMASMARMSADLYAASGAPKMREAAIMAGTRAVVFVKANASVTKDEAVRAKRIADELEASATAKSPAMAALQFCETRAKRWLNEGIVTPTDYQVTETEVRAALDAAVRAPAKPAGR